MKALSLWQPWASAMALGHKRIETRSWSTKYRGPLAIHAARRKMVGHVEIDLFYSLGIAGELPYGAVLATCELVDCLRTDEISVEWPRRDWGVFPPGEHRWGNFSPDRFAWVTKNMTVLPRPIQARGSQMLFDWEPS